MLQLHEVSKYFDETAVLRDVSFRLSPGESLVIFGGTGSGKSTLLRLIIGLDKPDRGQIIINGQDITSLRERQLVPLRRKAGIVFQEGALFDSLTVGQNVGYRLYDEGGWDDEEIREIVLKNLGFVELEHTIDLRPSELSGGMRRRVAIARALIGDPKIMLYDEPTAGLDPVTARTICDLMVKLRDLEGVASVVVTHDLAAAFFLSGYQAAVSPDGRVDFIGEGDRVCYIHTRFSMLRDGILVFNGNQRDLLQSADPYIREFLS